MTETTTTTSSSYEAESPGRGMLKRGSANGYAHGMDYAAMTWNATHNYELPIPRVSNASGVTMASVGNIWGPRSAIPYTKACGCTSSGTGTIRLRA